MFNTHIIHTVKESKCLCARLYIDHILSISTFIARVYILIMICIKAQQTDTQTDIICCRRWHFILDWNLFGVDLFGSPYCMQCLFICSLLLISWLITNGKKCWKKQQETLCAWPHAWPGPIFQLATVTASTIPVLCV
jgi:hypothetical protein